MAIICTATAAASQAHETRNTLIFGTRAKKVPLLCSLKPTQSLCVPPNCFAVLQSSPKYQQACTKQSRWYARIHRTACKVGYWQESCARG